MPTNREDVGDRYREILVPVPPDKKDARNVSKEFRAYFTGLSKLRASFADYLSADGLHHFTLTGGESTASAKPS
jgi:type I restriction enzyme M protein